MSLYSYLFLFLPTIQVLILRTGTGTAAAIYVEHLAQSCSRNNSSPAFKENLSLLFKSITSVPTYAGYKNDTIGAGPDSQAYGHSMCYADANLTACTDCLNSASYQMSRYCPDSKVASFWLSSGQCFIRYSNETFFSVVDTGYSNYFYSERNFSDLEVFPKVRNTLFDKLIAQVNASETLFASGQENVTKNDSIYGLLQCTRDLNHQDCYKCLNTYIKILQQPSYYSYSEGTRIYGLSCYLRYETNSNFMPTQEAVPPSASPVSDPEIAPGGPGTETKHPKKSNTIIIVAIVGGVATLLLIVTICIWFPKMRFQLYTTEDASALMEELQDVAASEFLIYDLTTISNATDNFSDKNKLGKGGFGIVFKGILANGQDIAVKRLSTSSTQGATEFKNEVDLLVRLRHNNLVQLLGCCVYEHERILCYEYLPNGSLDKILFSPNDTKSMELNWHTRLRIIKGISRGLLYLHVESPLKIVHRDLKASNILLDKDMNPKISDFGLARLFDRDQTHKDTLNIAGTFGYIAPELCLQGTFSDKSDVYSFGILVLEIITGRRNGSVEDSNVTGLTNHVWKHWTEGKVLELKDPTMGEESIEEVKKCIHIALLCLQANPSNRPNMEAVANMLNTSSIASQLPSLPPPRFIWGADHSLFDDDQNVYANLRKEYSVVGVESAIYIDLSH